MKKKINKTPHENSASMHSLKDLPENLLRFSFKYLHICEKYPLKQCYEYIGSLFDRLKAVSQMQIKDFITSNSKSLRSHSHDWSTTTEPNGYSNLNEHLKECLSWQFSLSSNEHGRVHGLLIDNVFYIVWLDPNHNLYN